MTILRMNWLLHFAQIPKFFAAKIMTQNQIYIPLKCLKSLLIFW